MPEAIAPPVGITGPNQQVDNSVTSHLPKPLLKTLAPVPPPAVAPKPPHLSKHAERAPKAPVAAPAPPPVRDLEPRAASPVVVVAKPPATFSAPAPVVVPKPPFSR